MRKLKWNGWGYEGEEFPQDRVKKIIDILQSFLGAKIFYAIEEKRIIPTPALGLYLGYSW